MNNELENMEGTDTGINETGTSTGDVTETGGTAIDIAPPQIEPLGTAPAFDMTPPEAPLDVNEGLLLNENILPTEYYSPVTGEKLTLYTDGFYRGVIDANIYRVDEAGNLVIANINQNNIPVPNITGIEEGFPAPDITPFEEIPEPDLTGIPVDSFPVPDVTGIEESFSASDITPFEEIPEPDLTGIPVDSFPVPDVTGIGEGFSVPEITPFEEPPAQDLTGIPVDSFPVPDVTGIEEGFSVPDITPFEETPAPDLTGIPVDSFSLPDLEGIQDTINAEVERALPEAIQKEPKISLEEIDNQSDQNLEDTMDLPPLEIEDTTLPELELSGTTLPELELSDTALPELELSDTALPELEIESTMEDVSALEPLKPISDATIPQTPVIYNPDEIQSQSLSPKPYDTKNTEVNQLNTNLGNFLASNNIHDEQGMVNYLKKIGVSPVIVDAMNKQEGNTNFLGMLENDMNAPLVLMEKPDSRIIYMPTTMESNRSLAIEIKSNGDLKTITSHHDQNMTNGIRFGDVEIFEAKAKENGNVEITNSEHRLSPKSETETSEFSLTSMVKTSLEIDPNGVTKQTPGAQKQVVGTIDEAGRLVPVNGNINEIEEFRNLGFNELYFMKKDIAGITQDNKLGLMSRAEEGLEEFPSLGIDNDARKTVVESEPPLQIAPELVMEPSIELAQTKEQSMTRKKVLTPNTGFKSATAGFINVISTVGILGIIVALGIFIGLVMVTK